MHLCICWCNNKHELISMHGMNIEIIIKVFALLGSLTPPAVGCLPTFMLPKTETPVAN